jgi:hypothetical protein
VRAFARSQQPEKETTVKTIITGSVVRFVAVVAVAAPLAAFFGGSYFH